MLSLVLVSGSLLFFFNKKMSWYQSIWSLAVASFISLTYLFSSSWTFHLESKLMLVDSMSTVLISLTLWISLMMFLASQASVKLSNNNPNSFRFLVIFLNLVLVITFSLSNVLLFYFMFEASLIPTLLLILGWGYQPERLQAGMYMMIYTVAASLPLLLIILWMMGASGSLNMMLLSLVHKTPAIMSWAWNLLVILVFAAFLVKLPMFSVHLWLPKAHVEAPVAGSMVLAAILLKLGGYGILRSCQFFNLHLYSTISFLLMVALWGGMLTAVICFRQIDLKALIAYSSIGHMSLMLAGSFSMTSWGWGGALALMLAHGFCSSALFSLANYSYEKTGTRSLFISKGMLMLIPILSMWWFLFSVLNMAAPPSINLLGEIMIFPSVIFASKWCIFPLASMSFLSALYSMYLFTTSQHGGSPKFLKPFGQISNTTHTLLALHWIPANALILKSDLVFLWI